MIAAIEFLTWLEVDCKKRFIRSVFWCVCAIAGAWKSLIWRVSTIYIKNDIAAERKYDIFLIENPLCGKKPVLFICEYTRCWHSAGTSPEAPEPDPQIIPLYSITHEKYLETIAERLGVVYKWVWPFR